MDYARLPALVQYAVVDVEAHSHLAGVERASRMWRTAEQELRELSDSLRHELDCLQPLWTDATGAEFVRRAAERKAAIDELLTRITQHQPWRALDDLARQLRLTRTRLIGTAEQPDDASRHEAAAHLVELDRYFHAAAEAVLGAAGDERPAAPAVAGGCCAEPSAMAPMLAGGPGVAPSMALDPGGGSSLPPGSVSIPGLIAVPPGSWAGGRPAQRQAADGTSAGSGSSAGPFDGSTPDGSTFDPNAVSGGSLADAGGPDLPPRIEQAADPVPLTESRAAPQAPQPPEQPATAAEPDSNRASGRMIPPMMMTPMMAGAGRSATGGRTGGARSLEGAERRTRTPQATPGVPQRLRGRSALADPAGSGYRPVAMSGTKHGAKEPAAVEALDHEVWQVADPAAASPLKPEAAEPEQPRRLRRPRA